MRVAVLGAGYAGLTLARKLESCLPDAAELVVVDESDTHLVQHELHRLLRRPELAEEIQLPLSALFDDATVRQASVEDVDPEAGVATLADGTELDYDVGAVCLGAQTAFYDLPGVQAHATPMKRVEHADRARADYREVLAEDGRVVVGGAGLSGVQVAGELAAMAAERDADPDIVLLERLDSVAPSFPENFQRAVHEELTDRGVTVRTGTAVDGADESVIDLATGDDLAYDQFIWTGGIRGPDALAADRPVVRSDLRLAGDTFAIGDAARVVDVDGRAVPASAQAAVREARVAATNIARLVQHRLDGGGFEPRLDR
ncbi:MAG: NAD(P)/FAD-dependent oxidoreductase, partial [Haloarculaceae archaeon]